MSQYIATYLGGDRQYSPKESKQHYSKYEDWLSSLGDSVVSPANPGKNTSTVNSDVVTSKGATTMYGFIIIDADSVEVALSIAMAWPFLDIGRSFEVSAL